MTGEIPARIPEDPQFLPGSKQFKKALVSASKSGAAPSTREEGRSKDRIPAQENCDAEIMHQMGRARGPFKKLPYDGVCPDHLLVSWFTLECMS